MKRGVNAISGRGILSPVQRQLGIIVGVVLLLDLGAAAIVIGPVNKSAGTISQSQATPKQTSSLEPLKELLLAGKTVSCTAGKNNCQATTWAPGKKSG